MLGSSWLVGGVRVAAVIAFVTATAPSVRAEDCEGETFPSTYALIEKAIFENHGCTDDLCHGSGKGGGLDLRPGASYDSLVDADATSVAGYKRVLAGNKTRSLLWVNLAAKTLPDEWTAPLRAMPADPQPALSMSELEAVRRWIEKGAPEEGVIEGTDTLLDACLPPPEPLVIKPLPPPDPGKGVQIEMPPWVLGANSEREVCFASYYDITDQVPPQFRGPDGTTFRYKFNAIRQTPLSHHLIVNLYTGSTPPESSVWGDYTCKGGSQPGVACSPTALGFCGEGGFCATDPVNSIACIGFGPGDGGLGINSAGFTGTQETASEFDFFPGVYREVPLKGLILWNSHAFNLTDLEGTLNAYLNFEFAAPEEQLTPARQIFNTEEIFTMNVPPFSAQEVCNIHQLAPNTNLFELGSHAHQRMKRWRTFLGAFTCDGGPRTGTPCSPFGADFETPDICAGAPCVSMVRDPVGDCNIDGEVTMDELLVSVNIANGATGLEVCGEADTNGDRAVSIDDIIGCVNAALNGVPPERARDAEESLLYVSLVYNDPLVLRFDEPMVFSRASVSDRSLTYCGLYDNGFTDPAKVKTRSGSPNPPFPLPGVGGPCQTPTHCTAGKVSEPCSGTRQAARDASCNSGTNTGDGVCDACPLRGGVTTEDEMFILLGQFFIPGS